MLIMVMLIMVRLIMTKLIMAMLVMVMSINVMLIKVMLIICISIHHDHGDVLLIMRLIMVYGHGNGHLPEALLQVVLLLLQLLDPLLVAQLHPGHGCVMMMIVLLMVLTLALMMTDIAHLAMMV